MIPFDLNTNTFFPRHVWVPQRLFQSQAHSNHHWCRRERRERRADFQGGTREMEEVGVSGKGCHLDTRVKSVFPLFDYQWVVSVEWIHLTHFLMYFWKYLHLCGWIFRTSPLQKPSPATRLESGSFITTGGSWCWTRSPAPSIWP